jgi:hypothetical protein
LGVVWGLGTFCEAVLPTAWPSATQRQFHEEGMVTANSSINVNARFLSLSGDSGARNGIIFH